MWQQLKTRVPAILFGLLGFCFAFKNIQDLDFWWHLSTGRWIVENRSFVHSDFLSYTFKDAPWMDLTWGFEVIQYLLYSLTHNYWLISLLFGSLAFLTAYFCYRTFELFREENDPMSDLMGYLVAGLALIAVEFRWIHRPEQFTHLFGTVLIFLLFSEKHQKTRVIWGVPLIQLLWVNTHGLFMIGPIITGTFLFDRLVEKGIKDSLRTITKERLFQVLIVQVLVCFLNPRGWDGAFFPFHLWEVLNHPFYRSTIPEATNPYKDGVWGFDTWALTAYLVLFFFSWFFPFSKEHIKEKLQKYGVGYFIFSLLLIRLSVVARRNIALFVLWTLPLVMHEVTLRLKQFVPSLNEEKYFQRARYSLMVVGAVSCLGLCSNTLRPASSNIRFGGEIASYEFPSAVIEKLKTLPKLPRFFAGVQFSDFMDFHLPGYESYIDGRFAEVYPREHFQRYMDVLAHPRLIDQEAERWKVEAVGLETRNPMIHGLIQYLSKHPQWELFFADETVVVFTKAKEGKKNVETSVLAQSFGEKRIKEIESKEKGWNPLNVREKSDVALGLTRLSETLLLLDASQAASEAINVALKIEADYPYALSMQCVSAFAVLEQKVNLVGKNSESLAALIGSEAPLVEERCRKAKKLGADKTTALYTSALLHLNLGKFQDSAREFSELVKRDPLSPQGHLLLGRSLAGIGRFGEAESSYLEAARLRPLEGEPLMELAQMYAMRGDKQKAEFYQKEANSRMQLQSMNH